MDFRQHLPDGHAAKRAITILDRAAWQSHVQSIVSYCYNNVYASDQQCQSGIICVLNHDHSRHATTVWLNCASPRWHDAFVDV